MEDFVTSPLQPVQFGQAMNVTFDSYYDLLKEEAGSLNADEKLQIKLVADIVDITAVTNVANRKEGYEWFSYYNLLQRSDLILENKGVAGDEEIEVGVAKFSVVYGEFLSTLSRLVFRRALSPEDLKRKNELDLDFQAATAQLALLSDLDYAAWRRYCEERGKNPADTGAHRQWAEVYGNSRKVKELLDLQAEIRFDIIKIIEKEYESAHDKEIVKAVVEYDKLSMKLCFPTLPDYSYLPERISLQYLGGLVPASSGQFDFRYLYGYSMSLNAVKNTQAGALDADFNLTTQASSSITTDWSASASARYGWIKVKANASEHTAISEDFKKATNLSLKSKAAFRLNINHGPWFDANLFNSPYIAKNPGLFIKFFGKDGSLLYYPKALILVRGFSAEFESSSEWTFDYERKFSASGGGGFKVFGINFGGASNYSRNVAEHKVERTGTRLKISDGDSTLRFVGYAVKKNSLLINSLHGVYEAIFRDKLFSDGEGGSVYNEEASNDSEQPVISYSEDSNSYSANGTSR